MNTQQSETGKPVLKVQPASLAAPWRVLFVGADPLWFGQITRDVGCLHPEWLCLYAPDVSETLGAEAFVLEGKAPGLREKMEQVKAVSPHLNCLVRCDLANKYIVNAWKGLGFPIVSTQNDASALVGSLIRNARLLEWTGDPAVKQLLPQIRKLPATPRLYSQVTEELRSPDCSLDVIAHLIRQDPVMSGKMLQLVNSAFFASAREISDMLDAAMILGSERIKSLILLAGVFSQYNVAGGVFPSIDSLVAHSIQVGVYSRAIALSETKNAETAEAAFTAGILHDMGKMILAGNLPERYKEARNLRTTRQLSELEAEKEVFGVNHAKIGACLLAAWGLPLPILEAVAWHHEPESSPEKRFSLLAAVYAANAFAHQADGKPANLNASFYEAIRLPDACSRWRQMFGLPELK